MQARACLREDNVVLEVSWHKARANVMTAVGQCTVVEVKRRQRKSGKEVLEITGTAVASSDGYSRKRSKQVKRVL